MRVALTGDMYAGKSELARALGRRGYHVVDFSDLLKQYAVCALNACGIPVRLEDVKRDKACFRPFLQELGGRIGFNSDQKYIDESLSTWDGESKVVFDNVRTEAQWSSLREKGFVLVEVRARKGVREERSSRAGVSPGCLEGVMRHPVEGRLRGCGSVVLDGADSPEENASYIERMHYGDCTQRSAT
jgi:hypothetical protein